MYRYHNMFGRRRAYLRVKPQVRARKAALPPIKIATRRMIALFFRIVSSPP
jgi:hypothetical protein